MTSRTARSSIVLLLLLVGVAGAYLGFDTYSRHARVFTDERTALARLDTMLASVNELSVTQRGYFEPGRGANVASSPQFQRVRVLTDELREHLASLRLQLSEPAAVEQVEVISTALDDFATTDTRVRTNLANDTYFSAADLVFSAAAAELRSVTTALIAMKSLTADEALNAYSGLQRRAALTAGAVGVVWTIGLLLLAWSPRTAAAATLATPHESEAAPLPVEVAPIGLSPKAETIVDLEAAATACAAMARATSAAELREVLADAASAIGGSGLVVWLGAGEELFAVLGHGYDPRMLARIGPLARQASNATALAWRTAEIQIVPGDQGRAGAIVVPLVSTQGCIGVLSAEVSSGRETDDTTRSVTMLFAAQLSTIVAAWPEPSASADDAHTAHTGSIAVTL